MYFQPWYLENWDMYFPEGVQNEFGYFEGPSQEIMYSGKDKRMLIETRFMVFFFMNSQSDPIECHLTSSLQKRRRKKGKKEGNPSKIIQVVNWSVYFKGLVFFLLEAGFGRDFD